MIKNRENFDEEELLRTLFQQSATEPGHDLKQNVMRQIEASNSKAFEYQPVIGRKSWIVILGSFFTLMAYLMVASSGNGVRNMKFPDLKMFTKWKLPSDIFTFWSALSLPQLSYPLMMAIMVLIVFGIYFMLSIKFGKRYFTEN